MANKMNLRQTLADFLKARPNERFTARQMAEWIFENQREACEEKQKNSQQDLSDDTAFIWQLVAEIGSNRPVIQRRWPQIRTMEGRPRQHYWTAATEAAEIVEAEKQAASNKPGNEIDWDACNRLAVENSDFREFISWVRQFHQTDSAKVGKWDLVEISD